MELEENQCSRRPGEVRRAGALRPGQRRTADRSRQKRRDGALPLPGRPRGFALPGSGESSFTSWSSGGERPAGACLWAWTTAPSKGSFLEPDPVLGYRIQLRLYRTTTERRGGGTVHPDPQRAGQPQQGVSESPGGEGGGETICRNLKARGAGGKARLPQLP